MIFIIIVLNRSLVIKQNSQTQTRWLMKLNLKIVHQDFLNDKDKFDNYHSDYFENSPYFNKTNENVLVKFKDEAVSIVINKFVELWSKMYSYIKDDDKCGKTAKGIKTNAVKNMYNMKIIKTYYLITNKYIIKCKLSEATIINLEAMSFIKCHYLASTAKGIYWMV